MAVKRTDNTFSPGQRVTIVELDPSDAKHGLTVGMSGTVDGITSADNVRVVIDGFTPREGNPNVVGNSVVFFRSQLEHEKPKLKEDIVRVLRVIEYVGPRERVEQVVAKSIHGEKDAGRGLMIRASTVGAYPEILERCVGVETSKWGDN